jgi:signal transduction histidine kinase
MHLACAAEARLRDVYSNDQRLRDLGQLEGVGGFAYLSGLPDTVPSAANLPYYLEILKDKLLLRQVLQVCGEACQWVYESPDDVAGLLDKVERNVLLINQARVGATEIRMPSRVSISGLRAMLRRKDTQRERINPADTIEEVLVLMHSELVGQQVELREGLKPDCLVLADKGQLQQVILNLVMNAVQAMHAQPAEQRRLELTLRRTNTNEVLVAVRDSGPGIPENQQGKLFEAFWTTKNHGLGIGLHISRSIIESHGGRLSFGNNSDQGATFSFTLPLAMNAGPARPGASSAAGPGAL